MYRPLRCCAFALILVACGSPAMAQQRRSMGSGGGQQAPSIPDGVHGHIVSVDLEKSTITMKDDDGRPHTYQVDQATTMKGPREGKVPSGLKDHRFHEGMEVTIVLDNSEKVVREIHFGIDRHAKTDEPESGSKPTPPVESRTAAMPQNGPLVHAKINSTDLTKHTLLVTTSDGKQHLYMIGSSAKFLDAKGKDLKDGLKNSRLKSGVAVTIVTASGGKKVEEVKLEK